MAQLVEVGDLHSYGSRRERLEVRAHHRQLPDPSGTVVSLAREAAEERQREAKRARQKVREKRRCCRSTSNAFGLSQDGQSPRPAALPLPILRESIT
jgi:hypothetical protein